VSGNGSISPSDYQGLVQRIRERVSQVVPPAATVLVVSKGDSDLTHLEGRRGWHFLRQPNGQYAGHHPADSNDVIGQLEEMRREGASYLVLPSTYFWWLDHYGEFKRHLDYRYRLVSKTDECMIFHLVDGLGGRADTALVGSEEGQETAREQLMIGDLVRGLLPEGAVAAVLRSSEAVGTPTGCRAWRLDKAVLSSGDKATQALRELASGETEFLVIPSSAYGWLERNSDLAEELRTQHRFVTHQHRVCEIYELARNGNTSPVRALQDNGTVTTPSEEPHARRFLARFFSRAGRDG
jgi:hypothetical protein